MNETLQLTLALEHWQGVAAMYKVEFEKQNVKVMSLIERIDVLKDENEDLDAGCLRHEAHIGRLQARLDELAPR